MSSRERWIVYPILFLALGLAMRVNDPNGVDFTKITCHRIKCAELTVGEADCQALNCAKLAAGEAEFQTMKSVELVTKAATADNLTTALVRGIVEPPKTASAGLPPASPRTRTAVAIEGTLALIDERGIPQLALVPTKGGGRIDLFRSDSPRGMDERLMWAIDDMGERVALLRVQHVPKPKLSPEKGNEKPKDEGKTAPSGKSEPSPKVDAAEQPPAPPGPSTSK